MSEWSDPKVVSTAPAFKAALMERLQSWPDLQGVAVTWGRTRNQVGDERIILGRVKRVEAPKEIGGNRRDERLELTVTIEVQGHNLNGMQYLEERAYAIEGELAKALRKGPADPTFGGLVINAQLMGDQLDEIELDEYWIARLTCLVVAKNRI